LVKFNQQRDSGNEYRGQLMIAISAQNQHILVEVRTAAAFQQRLKKF